MINKSNLRKYITIGGKIQEDIVCCALTKSFGFGFLAIG